MRDRDTLEEEVHVLAGFFFVVVSFASWFMTLAKDSRHAGSVFGAKNGRNNHFGWKEAAKVSFSCDMNLVLSLFGWRWGRPAF